MLLNHGYAAVLVSGTKW